MGAIIKAKEAMDRKRLTAFELTRNWFDFAFENPDKVNSMNGMLFMWLIEANNRAGWAMKFAFNTSDASIACGVSNRKTVWKALNELVDLGFVTMVYKSDNKHKPSVISLLTELVETDGSLDNALLNQSKIRTGTETVREQYADQYGNGTETVRGHSLKHENLKHENLKPENHTNGESDFSESFEEEKIIPLPTETESQKKEEKISAQKEEIQEAEILEEFPFEDFWDLYDKKIDKPDCLKAWAAIKDRQKEEIMLHHLPKYVATTEKKFRKHPIRYLRKQGWENEIIEPTETKSQNSKIGKYSYAKLQDAIYGKQ